MEKTFPSAGRGHLLIWTQLLRVEKSNLFCVRRSFRLKTKGPVRKYVTYRKAISTEQGKSSLGLKAQALDTQFFDNYAKSPYEVVGEFVEIHTGTDKHRAQHECRH